MSNLPHTTVPAHLSNVTSSYDGNENTARFVLDGLLYGPFPMSIEDYHVVIELIRLAKHHGAKTAANFIQERLSSDLESITYKAGWLV